jgi:hypothetical protein
VPTAASGLTWFLQSPSPERGPSASGVEGVLIIAGLVLLIVAIAIAALYLVPRLMAKRREHGRTTDETPQRLPSEEGRPWSSER